MKKFLVLGFASFAFISCKEEIIEGGVVDFYYNDPQPINDSELSKIPTKFKGKYIGDKQNLYITDLAIITDYPFKTSYHKSAIDSLGVYKDGKSL